MAVPPELRAAAELELRRRESEELLDFVPRISPKLDRPEHLNRLVQLLERTHHEPVFALCSVPPQFGKTETVLHGLAHRMRRRRVPDSYGYVSYNASIAEEKSALCRKYTYRAGLTPGANTADGHWTTTKGDEFFATGIGGPLTSRPISGVLVVDDPFKNREEAESMRERNRVEEWLESTAFARCHPMTSILVVHTRWHEDDLIARLMKKLAIGGNKRWEHLNLEAIDSLTDQVLWPKGRPREFLNQRRIDIKEHNWWSLYMGSPRPKGGELFRGLSAGYYDQLPNRYRIGKGLDLGYTGTTRSDASCGLVIAELHNDIFILDRAYAHADVPSFIPKLQALDRKWPGPWNFLCSSLEGKAIELAGETLKGVNINSIPTTSDKFVRAQPIAGAWNGSKDEATGTVLSAPRVWLPRGADWVPEFLEEVGKFTGVGDRADDQVDALAASFWDFKDGGSTGIYVPKGTRANAYRTGADRGY